MLAGTPPIRWLTALAIVLSGCASLQVRSYVDRTANFVELRTYAWGPPDAMATGDPRLDNNEFFDTRVRLAVEKGMAAKGFEKTTAANAGLLVHYHASVTQKIDVSAFDPGATYAPEYDRALVYDAGTLFVDIVDTRTTRLLWRGWAEGSLEGVIDDQALMEARIDEAVAQILERLPRATN